MNEAPRQDANRSEFGGQDAARPSSSREETPRASRTNDVAPRRSRRREEREPVGNPEDVAALPAFLMTPPRPVPAVERTAEPAASAESQNTGTGPGGSDEGTPATPKPRRRRRARFEGSEAPEGGVGGDDPSSVTE